MSSISILHLSDIHFKKKEIEGFRSFQKDVEEKMVSAIGEHVEKHGEPEYVVITGDIAFDGKNYKKADVFLEKLRELLPNSVFLPVPGNHDVDRSEVDELFSLFDIIAKGKVDPFLENDKRIKTYILPKFENYRTFSDKVAPGLFEDKDGYFWVKNIDDKEISFLGLNSAWACEGDKDRFNISLGYPQVKEALNRSKGMDHKILLMHHPPTNWLKDFDNHRTGKEVFKNCDLVLCGHTHSDQALLYQQPGESCICLSANASYTTGEKGYIGFQFMEVGFSKKGMKVKVWPYINDDQNQLEFIPHLQRYKGQGSNPYFEISTIGMGDKEKPVDGRKKKPEPNFHVFEGYKQFVLSEHRFLPMKGFETSLRIPIEIEQVYVSMRGQVHFCDFENNLEGKRKLKEFARQEQIEDLDMKGTFLASKKQKTKDIVILGDPGSGKTTLLKYILVMLTQGKGKDKLGLDKHLVPFFAPLQKLKDPDKEDFVDFVCRVCCMEKYAVKKHDFVKLLGEKGAIILLDGLDEVADEKTRLKTCHWIDEARKKYVGIPFVVTSRFSGYFGESRLEGNIFELSIQDFSPQEVEAYLVNWFETVEVAIHPGDDNESPWREKAREEALKLVEDINSSEHVKKLAVNPLMLQIIALVRRDRGTTLPDRRVELYNDCINVLLEKWDIARGLDTLLKARESRQLLQPIALWLHEEEERRSAPLAEIKEQLEKPLERIGKSDLDVSKLLSNIQERSGVFLEYSQGEYGFAHLGFQEYLAAEEIRNSNKVDLLIKNYGNRWWREVILLALSLDNPSIIEAFLEEIVSKELFKSDISIIQDAVRDSFVKPPAPFVKALKDESLPIENRLNAIRILKSIKGPSVEKAFKEALSEKNKILSLAAYQALDDMGLAEGIKKPRPPEVPGMIIRPLDESQMVLIPEGNFIYGSREDDKEAFSGEKPQQTIYLPAYYMDKYPVTNGQYCLFLNHANPGKRDLKKWINLSGEVFGEQCRIAKEGNKYLLEKGYQDYPVIYVSWYGAKAYAEWSGKRLPFEAEWEKAARGADGRKYPWGNEFDKNLCNTEEGGPGYTTPVGSYPQGVSPFDCFDMAGNVWEWCADWFDSNNDKTGVRLRGPDSGSTRVVRGGCWSYDSAFVRCAYRSNGAPGDRDYDIGIRVCQELSTE